jgi:spoIIIJ-associated protein
MSTSIDIENEFQESISKILEIMRLSGSIIVDTVESDGRKYLKVNLDGEDLSILIGHHGKTLAALKVVLALMAPKVETEQFGVLLDVNNYHSKREDYIRNMTQSAVDQVRLTTQPMELMAMNPSERRVVHLVVQENADIESESVGEDPDRRVVIKFKQTS